MPPHCDSLDGPVVRAAKRALETGKLSLVSAYVPEKAEAELAGAFAKTMRARALGPDAMEVADRWFYETAVRLHRQGEGAPYTGLKPAGLDVGPVIPRVEKALEAGDPAELVRFLTAILTDNIEDRFKDATAKKVYDIDDVGAAREYVEAMLGLMLYSHHVYHFIESSGRHDNTKEDKAA